MSSNKQNYNQSNNHSQSSSNQSRQSSQSSNGNNTSQASGYSITKQYGGIKGILKIDIVIWAAT